MKKSNFVAMILGTIGLAFFAIGMCMSLLPQWGLFRQGVAAGIAGIVVMLITLLIWRRMEGKEPIRLNGKTVGIVLLAIAGALMLGAGMCLAMVYGKMLPGIALGFVGIYAMLMLVPATKGIRD